VNPDSYIPLYGNEFLAAVRGHPSCVAIGYLRALWYYWHHSHCSGIKNEDGFMRRICELGNDEWEVAQTVIFGDFFQLGEDGLWHQGRASAEWEKSVENYNMAKNRAIAGAKARWNGKHMRR
jgi:uncharacterized protein YdaU (DUF1376 family)